MQAQTIGTKMKALTKTFEPLPWQIAPWRDKSQVMLLTGAAGGGKSHLALEKINAYCLKYPGAFALLMRKVKASMTSGTVLFFEDQVVISQADNPMSGVRHYPSKSRFEYANGSMVVYAGLEDKKQRERLKSIGRRGGVDIAYLEEATEFEEADFNAVVARMRGGAAPWQQIVLGCNPGPPTHWIYRRLIQGGEASVYYSRAEDNPHNSPDYLRALNLLTGVDKERLKHGRWVQAMGLIYDSWLDNHDYEGDSLGNVTTEADYQPGGGSVYWAVDDGYSAGSAPATAGIDPSTGSYVPNAHPRVFLLCQLRPNGQLCVFEESYACLRMDNDHIGEVLDDLGYPRPMYAAVDRSAAQLRGKLQAAGVPALKGGSSVDEQIKEMRSWVNPDDNGMRLLLVHPRCKHLRQEMVSYRYGDNEKPVKQYDHGPDALKYLTWRLRHQRG